MVIASIIFTIHRGCVIEISEDGSGGTYVVTLRCAPCSPELIPHVEPLRGYMTPQAALLAGKQLIDQHQWQFAGRSGNASLFVRKEWSATEGFAFMLLTPSSQVHEVGFGSLEAALAAGRTHDNEQLSVPT